MERILILGGSLAQIRFIETAKTLGLIIGVVDNNPKAKAVPFSDFYYQCSLTDLEGLRQIVKSFKPNGITCGTCDVGVLSAAVLCDEFDLPGISIESATLVKNKGLMIKSFEENGVPHPFFQVVRTFDQLNLKGIEFPLIVKPVDNSASRGVNIAYNIDELNDCIQNSVESSQIGEVIVEEFLEGPEVSVEVLVQNGQSHVLQVTDKITTGPPHFIETGHSQPSSLPFADVERIKELACQAVDAVKLCNGSAHVEIKLTSKGPKMIEIAGRQGADFITTYLLEQSTNICLSKYEILRALGKPLKFNGSDYSPGKPVAVKFIQAPVEKIEQTSICIGHFNLSGILDINLETNANQKYSRATSNTDRIGYVIATGETAADALSKCDKIIESIDFSTKES